MHELLHTVLAARVDDVLRANDGAALVPAVARELESVRGGVGVVRLLLPLSTGGEAVVIAGRDFTLDAELHARIERITGEGSVDLSVQEPPRLALVG